MEPAMSRYHDPSGQFPVERDACAIIAYVNKVASPTHGNVQRTIDALIKMGHRAGEIDGEGDGCGILTDIPRLLWEETLEEEGHSPLLAREAGFAVGHLLIPRELLDGSVDVRTTILGRFTDAGLTVLVERPGQVRSDVLASRARQGEPLFWQVALLCPDAAGADSILYRLQTGIEGELGVHVASLSTVVTAYKVHGAP